MNTSANLDELSLQVLALLQADGRISIREMSKRLGVSPTTVGARYNQLLEDGVVQVVAAPDPRKLGLDFHALVSARLSPGNLDAAVALLEARPEVTWIGLTLTDHAILFEIVARNARTFGEHKDALFAELPGFISAEVSVIWDVRKLRYSMLPIDMNGHSPAGRRAGTNTDDP
ncbi:winged helix-turn-helix transcriptional regulator [Paracoccus sp. (in: a-proteobacteria)]|uniref:Lrp/AsnC family transcriptional regulator n=1 Tax=Paracoccus sp. TaxID=267 RepID=UPI0032204BCF